MVDLRVAFWNVQNLFEPGTSKYAPKDEQELVAKLDVIARILDGLFAGAGPDLVGLAEIHTERILDLLMQRLRQRHLKLFEPCGHDRWTGLAVLARADRFTRLVCERAYRPWVTSMPRWMIARCQLGEDQGRASILLVVNHWRSRVSDAEGRAAEERLETARALRVTLARSRLDTCAIVLGDFNAEPFEEPFGEGGLRTVRHFDPRLWDEEAPSCLYNTAWRFLAEPDWWETVEARGDAYRAPRPRTTFNASPPVLFDQLLVSGRALRGGPISLRESSVAYAADDETASVTSRGYRRPLRWNYGEGSGSGASDHFPLVATFRMNGGTGDD
ncbi:endonuclease/exonuclease/phosphatase family protein [Sorangium sp. So ce1151]|uniref:endonuclease/exonuclease/phosphatase family protein n=1 Tax=Sorangium sp. So ce1151 TaxID=3133332 RepID=UPI003F638D7B